MRRGDPLQSKSTERVERGLRRGGGGGRGRGREKAEEKETEREREMWEREG
jgi:hypothetical protein